jgi:transcriptional regulator with XRE-family HTH domain
MDAFDFRERLAEELKRRRHKNRRYSMRAFALLLGADHSTVSQVLRGTRRPPLNLLRKWASKLGVHEEETAIYAAAEKARKAAGAGPGQTDVDRVWEAIRLAADPAHREILRLMREPGFREDSRWIAGQISLSVDEVNMAFDRLLRFRLIETGPSGQWRALFDLGQGSDAEFHKLVVARLREMAVEARLNLDEDFFLTADGARQQEASVAPELPSF